MLSITKNLILRIWIWILFYMFFTAVAMNPENPILDSYISSGKGYRSRFSLYIIPSDLKLSIRVPSFSLPGFKEQPDQ